MGNKSIVHAGEIVQDLRSLLAANDGSSPLQSQGKTSQIRYDGLSQVVAGKRRVNSYFFAFVLVKPLADQMMHEHTEEQPLLSHYWLTSSRRALSGNLDVMFTLVISLATQGDTFHRLSLFAIHGTYTEHTSLHFPQ